MTKSQALLFVH